MPEWLDILLKILFIPIILWPITFFILAIFLMERSIKKHEKERKESLLNLAKTKNLRYSDKLSSLPLTTIEHSLFNPKINKIENLNILSGLAESIEFFIVDQRFKQHKNTKFACACILKKDFLDFPMFSLEKKPPNFEALKRNFAIEVKDIIDDPVFTSKIYVNGNESEINSFFDERIKNIFLKRILPEYKYSAFKDCFIVFLNKRISPIELMKMQNHSIQLLKSLINNEE